MIDPTSWGMSFDSPQRRGLMAPDTSIAGSEIRTIPLSVLLASCSQHASATERQIFRQSQWTTTQMSHVLIHQSPQFPQTARGDCFEFPFHTIGSQ